MVHHIRAVGLSMYCTAHYALPLSMLLSSIMTFGNLGESYELVAIKAAGVSLRNAMAPLFILVGIFAGGAFIFSDYTLPVVNLKMGTMLLDIRNQKADFLIKPGVFNNSIPGYSIRARSKSQDGTILHDLLIYNHTTSSKATNILIAKEGYMHNSVDNQFMILQLRDGVQYEDARARNATRYDERQQFTRFRFKESTQKFSMESFGAQKTDASLFKSHHQMLNLKQLKHYSDSNHIQLDSVGHIIAEDSKRNINYFTNYYNEKRDSLKKTLVSTGNYSYPDLDLQSISGDKRNILNNANSQVNYVKDIAQNRGQEYKLYVEKDIRYDIEWHRKFTLAASCLLLFGIGAPLGAIIRKGGLGLPVVMAIVFFLIYHVIFTISEKAAKDGSLDPIIGMWMAIIVLTPLAIFLTYKSTTDSALFDIDQYKIKAQKTFNILKEKVERFRDRNKSKTGSDIAG
ncbi:LptF/LptG family permease [Sphingobacterium populi]|uniref:LptF/LptG family permease n=1 Tax=Sphingobacterium sp. CFCC 11742 TaxID=1775560 RepID=UPI0029342C6D|nr:LptF/LptG family permease [Sphingobacterium sp. CFCC 11742]